MVRRKHSQHRVGIIALDEKGSEAACRRGVARHRFLHNLRRGKAGQLVGDLVCKILVGNDPGLFEARQRLQPLHGLLDHGALPVQGQNLLGVSAP